MILLSAGLDALDSKTILNGKLKLLTYLANLKGVPNVPSSSLKSVLFRIASLKISSSNMSHVQ